MEIIQLYRHVSTRTMLGPIQRERTCRKEHSRAGFPRKRQHGYAQPMTSATPFGLPTIPHAQCAILCTNMGCDDVIRKGSIESASPSEGREPSIGSKLLSNLAVSSWFCFMMGTSAISRLADFRVGDQACHRIILSRQFPTEKHTPTRKRATICSNQIWR